MYLFGKVYVKVQVRYKSRISKPMASISMAQADFKRTQKCTKHMHGLKAVTNIPHSVCIMLCAVLHASLRDPVPVKLVRHTLDRLVPQFSSRIKFPILITDTKSLTVASQHFKRFQAHETISVTIVIFKETQRKGRP